MNEDNRFYEALAALFGLGVVAFSPLVLDVFDGPPRLDTLQGGEPAVLFGVPLLYLYLFAAWGILIALMALVVHRAGAADPTLEASFERREESE